MNIFILDKQPSVCAKLYSDKHVCKMLVESVQMLSTDIYCKLCNGMDADKFKHITGLYKPTHKAHPCTMWVRRADTNFNWLYDLASALASEYEYRFNRVHKTKYVLDKITRRPTDKQPKDFCICIDKEKFPAKYNNEPIHDYRLYYSLYKDGKRTKQTFTLNNKTK